jgi:hypothetical protein
MIISLGISKSVSKQLEQTVTMQNYCLYRTL